MGSTIDMVSTITGPPRVNSLLTDQVDAAGINVPDVGGVKGRDDIKVTTKPKKRTRTAVRLQPPYNVVIFNDDYHSMQFVAEVLCKVLGCTLDRAVLLSDALDGDGAGVQRHGRW